MIGPLYHNTVYLSSVITLIKGISIDNPVAPCYTGGMSNHKIHKIKGNDAESWYENGKRHRRDGPAVAISTGYQAWYIRGELHRTDGPALTWPDGSTEWYMRNNRLISYDRLQLLTKCGDDTIMMLKLRWGRMF